jgi:hypothetical protein
MAARDLLDQAIEGLEEEKARILDILDKGRREAALKYERSLTTHMGAVEPGSRDEYSEGVSDGWLHAWRAVKEA